MLVGGKFDRAHTSSPSSEINTHNVAVMTLNSAWIETSSPIPELNAQVRSIRKVNTNIYVGGDFTNLMYGNTNLQYLTYWDTVNMVWMSVRSPGSGVIGVNSPVYALENGSGVDLLLAAVLQS